MFPIVNQSSLQVLDKEMGGFILNLHVDNQIPEKTPCLEPKVDVSVPNSRNCEFLLTNNLLITQT